MGDQSLKACAQALVAVLLLFAGAPAWAAAGPYVVDDSAIVEPGECKFEAWVSRSDTSDHLGVASPACTFAALPLFEIGLTALRGRAGGVYETLVGPKLKTELVPPERFGVGIGAMVSATYSLSQDRADGVVAFIPLTVEPIESLRISLNLGWGWDCPSHRHAATSGLGAEWQVHPRLAIIGETYGQDSGRWAKQVGLRPTLVENVLDLDVVYGRNIDGTRSNWATVGAIVKF
jgi:hypothetical protein